MPPQLWIDTALALRRDAADAYFISCANISAIDAIATLEVELGRPVVTSNQAALWCSLRAAGIADRLPASAISSLCRRRRGPLRPRETILAAGSLRGAAHLRRAHVPRGFARVVGAALAGSSGQTWRG